MMPRHSVTTAWLLMLVSTAAFCAAPATQPATTTAPTDPRWVDLPNTNTVFKPATYATLDDWKTRREALRTQIRFAAGLIPEPERTPLEAQITDRREYDGYTIEKVCFQSQPGLYVFGNLYRPIKIEGKIPAVACALGHWGQGRLHQDDTGNYPTLGGNLARLGVTVLIYDMTGYNESGRQLKHGINTAALDLWGITSLGLQTWTSIRVIDFLQSLPEVDPERIGMTGASGGGTQTFILTAIDDRVKVAVPVNMISCSMQGGCACENAPALRIDTNNMEFGAMAAPRPMLMISTSGDWTKRTPEVEYPFVRSIYTLYGAANQVANVHLNYPHNYNHDSREAMYRFFAKWLLKRDDAETIKEGAIRKFAPGELLVWTDATAPKDIAKIDQLAEAVRENVRRQIAAMKPTDTAGLEKLNAFVRTGLQYSVGSILPAADEVQCIKLARNNRAFQKSERAGRSVDGWIWRAAFGSPGTMAATQKIIRILPTMDTDDSQFEQLLGTTLSSPVITISFTPFPANTQPPQGAKPRGSSDYFTTFNRVDAAETVYDTLTALATELRQPPLDHTALIGAAGVGPQCLLARALVPAELAKSCHLRTAIDMNGFGGESDKAYLEQLNIPHIRQIGGIETIAAVAANGPLWLHNVGDKFDAAWVQAAAKINGVEVRVTREPADDQAILEWLAK